MRYCLPYIFSSTYFTHYHIWSRVKKLRAIRLYTQHNHSFAVLYSSRFMVPEKHVLLANTNDFSSVVAFCWERLFSSKKNNPVTEKVLRSEIAVGWVWEDATCKFLSLSLQNRQHPYWDAHPLKACWPAGFVEMKEQRRGAARIADHFVFLLLPLSFEMLCPSLLF